ncbi:SMI1/KNR4 family protein [Kordia sp.]|uniref:SMI1/KNR4 family protein n=1 Tax=Kordia sp. TaxID=1965332 RepID=UPI003D2B4BCB
MPFPIEEKYILKIETDLNVKFPAEFKNRMIQLNGGEIVTRKYAFGLYPFFDTSDRKRISRTCNHIGLETKNAREWNGFPKNAIAIGSDGSGDQIVLTHNGDGILTNEIYFWNHETRHVKKIAESILQLSSKKDNSFWQRIKSVFNRHD